MNEPYIEDKHLGQTRVASLQIPGYRHLQDARVLTRLTGNGNYTWIELMSQRRPILVSQTLMYFERQLPGFIRVSKSVLLNPAWIVSFVRPDSRTLHLTLADGSRIDVPRRRIHTTIHKLEQRSSPTVLIP